RQAFLVPTLITYEALTRRGSSLGLTAEMSSKLKTVLEAGFASVEIALQAGVQIGFGTDLLGEMHEHQNEELSLRATVQRPADVIAAATAVNAEILGMTWKLGIIAPGAFGDLIAVEGNPLEDISLLRAERLDLIVKGGQPIHSRYVRSGCRSTASPMHSETSEVLRGPTPLPASELPATQRRIIRPAGFFALSFGSMVGSGWIILLGEWLRRAAPGGAFLALLGGGALMSLIGTCYAELAARMPRAGGEFRYALEGLGRAPAFIVGWFLTLFLVSLCAL